MTITPANYLREARLWRLRDATVHDAAALRLEEDAVAERNRAAKCREQAAAFGAGIQVIDGDDAPLDLPTETALPSQLELSR